MKYAITTWPGEHRTLHYVVAVSADDDWEVVDTFETYQDAVFCAFVLTERERYQSEVMK